MSIVSLGIEQLDAEHREILDLNVLLFNAINNRGPTVDTLDVTSRLYRLATNHFKNEEEAFEGWEGGPNHVLLHNHVVRKLNTIFAKFDSQSPGYTAEKHREHLAELSELVGGWLNDHIALEDTKYIPYVLEKQRAPKV